MGASLGRAVARKDCQFIMFDIEEAQAKTRANGPERPKKRRKEKKKESGTGGKASAARGNPDTDADAASEAARLDSGGEAIEGAVEG